MTLNKKKKIKKWAEVNRRFSKEDTQMAEAHEKMPQITFLNKSKAIEIDGKTFSFLFVGSLIFLTSAFPDIRVL